MRNAAAVADGAAFVQSTFQQSNWLYSLAVPRGGSMYVHLPLVYSTRDRCELELYARALKRFPALIDDRFAEAIHIADGVVVRFSRHAYSSFLSRTIRRTSTRTFSVALLDAAYRHLAAASRLCEEAERRLSSDGAVSSATLKSLAREIQGAIAVNLGNVFFELGLGLCRTGVAGGTQPGTNVGSSFSHIAYYGEAWRTLRLASTARASAAVLEFCWNAGCLAPRHQPGIDYSNPHEVLRALGRDIPRAMPRSIWTTAQPPLPAPLRAGLQRARVPDNSFERVRYCLGVLATHEELRHYWQARAMRLIRAARSARFELTAAIRHL